MAKAAEILGVEHHWLGFVDSGLPEGDPPPPLPDGCLGVVPLDEPVEELVRVIRKFRPHVMTTYDENGGYPHPDHIRTHGVGGRLRGRGGPCGTPTRASRGPLKLYYNQTISKGTCHASDADGGGNGLEPSRCGVDRALATGPRRGADHTQGRARRTSAKRDEALLAHATQIDPNGAFFSRPRTSGRGSGRPRGIRWEQRWYVPISPIEDDLLARFQLPMRPPNSDQRRAGSRSNR